MGITFDKPISSQAQSVKGSTKDDLRTDYNDGDTHPESAQAQGEGGEQMPPDPSMYEAVRQYGGGLDYMVATNSKLSLTDMLAAIYRAELSYNQRLRVVVVDFARPMMYKPEDCGLSRSEVDTVFFKEDDQEEEDEEEDTKSLIESMQSLHSEQLATYRHFKAKIALENISNPSLGLEELLWDDDLLELHDAYASKYGDCVSNVSKLYDQRPKFRQYLCAICKDPGYNLMFHLFQPVIRIVEYYTQLTELKKKIPGKFGEKDKLEGVMHWLEQIMEKHGLHKDGMKLYDYRAKLLDLRLELLNANIQTAPCVIEPVDDWKNVSVHLSVIQGMWRKMKALLDHHQLEVERFTHGERELARVRDENDVILSKYKISEKELEHVQNLLQDLYAELSDAKGKAKLLAKSAHEREKIHERNVELLKQSHAEDLENESSNIQERIKAIHSDLVLENDSLKKQIAELEDEKKKTSEHEENLYAELRGKDNQIKILQEENKTLDESLGKTLASMAKKDKLLYELNGLRDSVYEVMTHLQIVSTEAALTASSNQDAKVPASSDEQAQAAPTPATQTTPAAQTDEDMARLLEWNADEDPSEILDKVRQYINIVKENYQEDDDDLIDRLPKTIEELKKLSAEASKTQIETTEDVPADTATDDVTDTKIIVEEPPISKEETKVPPPPAATPPATEDATNDTEDGPAMDSKNLMPT